MFGNFEKIVSINCREAMLEEEINSLYPIPKKIKKDAESLRNMKTIEVVAAIILKEGRIFATQRGYGEFKGWWEFPGGKIESGECPQEALKREIREELDAEIEVRELLETVEWDYPNFHLTMHCFICSLLSESLHLNEHEAATWLTHETLRSVMWLPADEILLDRIAEYLK